jgi:uncharacterized protein (TIGR03435 family)
MLLLAAAISIAMPSAPGQVNIPTGGIATKLPAYDVVSIKPNKSGSGSLDVESNATSYSARNISLKQLLQNAYDIKEDLISGVPGPIASARFDIEAKIVEPNLDALKKLSEQQQRSMLLPFLAERFQLKAHTEIKTLPVYELVVIQNGPKFKQSPNDSERGGGTSVSRHGNLIELTVHDRPMASLASTLAGQVHRTVIDKTGLMGDYDLALKWSPDDSSGAETDVVPSIFTGLQEQLGLKLQPAKGPVETLVVDHVEMPSEN